MRDVLADGAPCSYFIHENISQIAQGAKFFGKVSSANISADGYISNCPGKNKNEFTLSGELCIKWCRAYKVQHWSIWALGIPTLEKTSQLNKNSFDFPKKQEKI